MTSFLQLYMASQKVFPTVISRGNFYNLKIVGLACLTL